MLQPLFVAQPLPLSVALALPLFVAQPVPLALGRVLFCVEVVRERRVLLLAAAQLVLHALYFLLPLVVQVFWGKGGGGRHRLVLVMLVVLVVMLVVLVVLLVALVLLLLVLAGEQNGREYDLSRWTTALEMEF